MAFRAARLQARNDYRYLHVVDANQLRSVEPTDYSESINGRNALEITEIVGLGGLGNPLIQIVYLGRTKDNYLLVTTHNQNKPFPIRLYKLAEVVDLKAPIYSVKLL